MKKTISLIICMAVLASMLTINAFAEPNDISAKAAILYCADTGDTLYAKNADERRLIASVTKIMTAIVVIENCNLDEVVKLKPEWCAVRAQVCTLITKKPTP